MIAERHWQPIASALRARIEERVRLARATGVAGVLVESFAVGGAVDPLAAYAAGRTAFADAAYFSAPDDAFALCALGNAHEVRLERSAPVAAAAERVRDAVATVSGGDAEVAARLAFVGGFAFDPVREPGAEWAAFPAGRLVLPRILLRADGRAATLTLALRIGPDDDASVLAERLAAELAAAESAPPVAPATVRHASFAAEPAGYLDVVARLAAAIRAGDLEKVVIARRLAARADAAFDAPATLRRLRASDPGAYVFALDAGGRTFLGGTPERLIALYDGRFDLDCLAGTTARGATPAEDARLGAALLASAKNRREHAVVVDAMRAMLADCCEQLSAAPEPRLRATRAVQHLDTPVSGRVRPGRTVLDLVARLHPTPAVGGSPRPAALAAIRAAESFDRGWYAGPVGWVDGRGDGEFAVAIRSALIGAHDALLYAGGGIMGDSDPQAERAETEMKFATMLAALGLDG